MALITPEYCFTTGSGENIYLFTLTNANGNTVTITNYGAIIMSFNFRRQDGVINDIVLGLDKPEDYLSPAYLAAYPYFGAAIGRYANRIANAEFVIDGRKYQVTRNNGPNQLHGGASGFDKKTWTMHEFSENRLSLKYSSPDGEEGFPGNLDVTIRFKLTDADELVYEYEAVTDLPTAVNLTHHSYFNLDGSKSINEHDVKLNSAIFLEQDQDFVVTGKQLKVEGTIYDFTKVKRIDTDWLPQDGYDQSFVLNDNRGSGLQFAAEAFSARSGLKLEVYTSEPLVHFYTGKWIPVTKGKNQQVYTPFSGLCFETQKHPNAVNIPGFPDTILRPGQRYHSTTRYRVSQVAEK